MLLLITKYMKKVKDDAINYKMQADLDDKMSGSLQNEGCYKCCNCGKKVYLDKQKILPLCPRCNYCIFEFMP